MSHKNLASGDILETTASTSMRVDREPVPAEKVPHYAMLLALAAVVITFGTVFSAAQNVEAAKLTEDLPPGPMQAKAIASCQECHEARIILQQRLSKAAWTKEVDKMIKWGALVDAADHDPLIDYLSSNFGSDQPPYEPPRSASGKTSAHKTK